MGKGRGFIRRVLWRAFINLTTHYGLRENGFKIAWSAFSFLFFSFFSLVFSRICLWIFWLIHSVLGLHWFVDTVMG